MRERLRITTDKREIKDSPKLPSATSFIRETLLTGLGLKDFIMHKGAKGKKLTDYHKMMNKSISKVRYIVEQLFGILKRHYNFTRGEYLKIKESQYWI